MIWVVIIVIVLYWVGFIFFGIMEFFGLLIGIVNLFMLLCGLFVNKWILLVIFIRFEVRLWMDLWIKLIGLWLVRVKYLLELEVKGYFVCFINFLVILLLKLCEVFKLVLIVVLLIVSGKIVFIFVLR